MTELQKHLLQLLREIDITCDELGIRYALFGGTAEQAKKKGRLIGGCYELHVMMAANDMLLLKHALSSMQLPDRALEDLSTNPKLALNVLRYVDTSTTLFDLEMTVRYQELGAAVTIHPLFMERPAFVGEKLGQGLFFLNGGREYSPFWAGTNKRLALRFGRAFVSAFGERAPAWLVYTLLGRDSTYEQARAEGRKSFYYNDVLGYLRKCPMRYFSELERTTFSGVDTFVPSDLEGYVKMYFGNGLAPDLFKPLRTENSIMVLSDAYTPYRDTLAYLKEEGYDLRDIEKRNYEHIRWCSEQYQYWESIAYHEYDAAKLSRDRIDLYITLRGDMDELRRANAAGDVDSLAKMLAEYLELTDDHLRKKWGLFINQEIFDMASKVWAQREKAGYAESVLALVPDAHRHGDIESMLAPYLTAADA